MAFKLKKPATEVTEEEVVALYRAFCDTYGLEFTKSDREKLKIAYSSLKKSPHVMGHYPAHNIRFIGQGVIDGVLFFGHNQPDDEPDTFADAKFQKLAKEYLAELRK